MHQAAGEANESQGFYDPAIREYRAVLAQDPRRPGHPLPDRPHAPRPGAGLGRGRRPRPRARRRSRSSRRSSRWTPRTRTPPTSSARSTARPASSRRRARCSSWRLSTTRTSRKRSIGLGACLIGQGEPEQALPHLQKAIASNPATRCPITSCRRPYGSRSGNAPGAAESPCRSSSGCTTETASDGRSCRSFRGTSPSRSWRPCGATVAGRRRQTSATIGGWSIHETEEIEKVRPGEQAPGGRCQ